MEIIVGRDQNTRQLNIIKDGNSKLYGQPGSVPMDVSRQHISLQPVGAGKWKLKNLNERNVTFVNGIAIESKTVSVSDKIELGNSHYLFLWNTLSEPKEETIDIRPLRRVWEDYNQSNISITMLGGLLSGIAPDNLKTFAYIFTAIALVVMLYGFYKRFTDNSIEEQEEIKKNFQNRYVCPKCGHFMGFQDYDLLIQNDACGHCKTKFRK